MRKKLIDKDALAREIRKRLLPVIRDKHYDEWEEGQDSERIAILDIIDTLGIKEVDLEKEYKDFVEEDPVYNKLVNGIVGKAIAKHFFELGLKAQKGE